VSLEERLREDMRSALKAGPPGKLRLSVVRMILAALQNARIEKGSPLDESDELKVLARERKQKQESLEEFRKAHRPDTVARMEEELALIESYLPQQMSRAEVSRLARRVIDETGAGGPRDVGRVMGKLMPQVRGRADGALVNEVVRELLAREQGE